MKLKKGRIIFDQYEVTRLKGEGGQAFVAEGISHQSGRKVLIKARKSSDNPLALERFRREGSFKINDPHIVSPIIGDENYIIFPLINADDLKELMSEKAWLPSNEDVLIIAVKVCQALKVLHAHNVIHRDIKPGNILYNRDNQMTVLIDMGAARFKALPQITSCDNKIATPLYVSPEQIENPTRVDARSDIYSLGTTLYRLVTGTDAFDALSVEKIIHRILHDNFQPIKQRNPRVPELLDSAITKMIAKNPDDRFADANEVIMFLTGQSAAKTSAPYEIYCIACGMKTGPDSCAHCGRDFLADYRMMISTPDHRRRIYGITVGDYCVGRPQLGNQKHVSKEHCRFSVSPSGEIHVHDNKSTNKTYVNRIFAEQPIQLALNSILEIADLTATILPVNN